MFTNYVSKRMVSSLLNTDLNRREILLPEYTRKYIHDCLQGLVLSRIKPYHVRESQVIPPVSVSAS